MFRRWRQRGQALEEALRRETVRFAPTGEDYTIPEQYMERTTIVRAVLERVGATEAEIHTMIAIGDLNYLPKCCGHRQCAEDRARVLMEIFNSKLKRARR
jgi:hypothetical protein